MIENVKYLKLKNMSNRMLILKWADVRIPFQPFEERVFNRGIFLHSLKGKVSTTHNDLAIVEIEYTNAHIQPHPIHEEKNVEIENRWEILDL